MISVLVPVFVDYGSFYPYVYPKVFLFSLLVTLSVFLFSLYFFQNQEFRNKILEKTKYLKNKIFLSLTAFMGISILSTLTAFDRYSAFWGNVERGEGFVGLLYLFIFLVLLVLNFEKKDWIWFFRISLLTTILMLGKSFIEYAGGLTRPNSFIGNPAFLAGYFLYSVTSAFIVWREDINKWWKYLAMVVLPLSIVGIFLTQTRGAILGFLGGIFVVLFYFLLKGEDVYLEKYNLKKIVKYILGISFIFVFLFIFTRSLPVWQKVPGLSRVASISLQDSTTSSRFLVWKASLVSVDPLNNIKEFLIGWGSENLVYSLAKNYDPLIYKYDTGDFDRAHNKFIDVWVMYGIFALVAYLLFWFFVFKKIFKDEKEFSWENVALIFFFSSFAIHLFFVFDQIPTSIIFFILLAYLLYSGKNQKTTTLEEKRYFKFIPIVFVLFFVYVFTTSIMPAYLNMKKFNTLFKKDFVAIDKNIEKVLNNINPAQGDMIAIFLKTMYRQYPREGVEPRERFYIDKFADLALAYGEFYAEKNPKDFQFFVELANAYIVRGKKDKEVRFFERAEFYINKALEYAPKRPDYLFLLEDAKKLKLEYK